MTTCNAVDPGDPGIHLLDQLCPAEFCHANTRGIAVGCRSETSHDDILDPGCFPFRRLVVVILAADHVCVHAGSADVFADFIQHEDVGCIKGKLWHPFLCQEKELFFTLFEILRGDCLDPGCLVVAVFDNGQPRHDPALCQHLAGNAADNLAKVEVGDRAMVDLGTRMLAKPDQHHFHQSAFNIATEICVWLYSAYDDDMVGTVSMLVEMNWKALLGITDNHCFHAGLDGTIAELLGNAIAFNDSLLSLGCPSPVTSHRRDDKWPGIYRRKMIRDCLDDEVNIGNATTARGNGNGLAWLDLVAQLKL